MGFLRELFGEVKRVFTWWVVITPWERGLRVRFGKKIKVLNPGLHWAFPVADRVFRQSIRMRISDLPIQTLTTRDGKCLTLKGQIGYEISSIERLYMTLHHAEDTLVNLAAAKIADYVSTRHSEDITPDWVRNDIQELLDFERYGLGGVNLTITDFAYVRTYRLIQSSGWYASGDTLETTMEEAR